MFYYLTDKPSQVILSNSYKSKRILNYFKCSITVYEYNDFFQLKNHISNSIIKLHFRLELKTDLLLK